MRTALLEGHRHGQHGRHRWCHHPALLLPALPAVLQREPSIMLPSMPSGRIGSVLTTILERKRQTPNGEQPHMEWDRRVGKFSAAIIAATLTLTFSLHLILPYVFGQITQNQTTSKHQNSLTAPLLAMAFVSVLLLLGAHQLAAVVRRQAGNGPLYRLAFGTAGRGLAFWLAWSQLVDALTALALAAHSLAQHTDLLFRNARRDTVQFEDQLPWLTAGLPLLAGLLMMCSLRVLLTVNIVFLVAALFTTASTGTVAVLHAVHTHFRVENATNKTLNGGIGFGNGFHLFLLDARFFLLGWLPLEALTFLAEECTHPRRTLPPLITCTARTGAALTLVALLAFFSLLKPVIGFSSDTTKIDYFLPLPALFATAKLYSARYLLSVGSICALWALLLSLHIPASRLLVLLASDRFLPACFTKLSKKGGQPRFAVFLVASCASAVVLFLPKHFLLYVLPLNVCLRLIAQAALAFLAHFWPNNVENFPNRANTQKYRRIHGANRSISRDELEAGTSPEEDEDGSDWENHSEQDEDDDVGGWALAAHGQLLEAILRLASGGRRPSALEEEQYVGKATNANNRLIEGETKEKYRIPQHHNCLHSPCRSPTSNSLPQSLHLYDTDGNHQLFGQTQREESGSRAAATLDEHQAWSRAKWAITGVALLALVCAFSVKAIRDTQEYTPLLALIGLLVSVPLAAWIALWLGRTRVDGMTGASVEGARSKLLPVGSLFSIFVLIQAIFLFTAHEWQALGLWNILGIIIFTVSLAIRSK